MAHFGTLAEALAISDTESRLKHPNLQKVLSLKEKIDVSL
jgi:hypothetical protein